MYPDDKPQYFGGVEDIGDHDRELHPIGTGDELRAVTNALKHAGYTATDIMSEVAAWANRTREERDEIAALRERCAALDAENERLTTGWQQAHEAKKLAMRVCQQKQDALALVQDAFDDRTKERNAARAWSQAWKAAAKKQNDKAQDWFNEWLTAMAQLRLAADMPDTLQADYTAAMVDIGKLYAMVQHLHAIATNGHDDDTLEVIEADKVKRCADEVIGAPPVEDMTAPEPFEDTSATESTHAPDGLAVLSARDAAQDDKPKKGPGCRACNHTGLDLLWGDLSSPCPMCGG
jgi:hypothetical protein